MKGLAFTAPLALVLAVPLAAQSTPPAEQVEAAEPVWAFEQSDLEPEKGYIFGVLDNGMRYVIRANATPAGTALVRMEIGAGRLDEGDSERGAAHFVEHMVFNGSTNVPEGEMVKLLERLGLRFGADTNAETNMGYTQYKLDLPNTSPELLDTALFLMREVASEAVFDPAAVDRERGILLAEQRDRTNYSFLNVYDLFSFAAPDSRLVARFPGAGREDLEALDAATLRSFWERNYVPAKTTLVVVGDFDAAEVEAKIKARFADWSPRPSAPQPSAGPVDPARAGETDIYLDPALSEQVSISRTMPWSRTPDTLAAREDELMRAIGYDILARRFRRATQGENPPFRGVSFSTGEAFDALRETSLGIAAIDGRWAEGLAAAVKIYRQFLEFGVSETEIAEQLANRRTALENALAGQDTRSHSTFAERAIGLIRNGSVPTSPADNLAMLEAVADKATPEAVIAALKADMIPLDNPLIRFSGRTAPEGGADALRAAWDAALAAPVVAPDRAEAAQWAYTDFGPAGKVVSDTMSAQLDIRQVVFANGVMLNLKQTDLAKDQISVSLGIDGGNYLDTREAPLNTHLTALLAGGGLGQHSLDELQTILAGRSANFSLSAATDRFTMGATTTPRDLELQLQLIAAYLTDPGYRPEPVTRFRNGLDDYFARLTATPGGTLGAFAGKILSDSDPRFTTPEADALRALDFDGLRAVIADRLQNGAMEIALVGDFDEERAIALVARTLGALPQREQAFRDYPESRQRGFTSQRGSYTLFHDGEANQALVNFTWPTRDYDDPQATIELNLLRAVVELEMTDALREQLGKAYSPGVSNSQSRFYDGYGVFSLGATVDTGEVAATRDVIDSLIERLRTTALPDDTLERARQPILQDFDNALKTNASWMAYTARAQSDPEQIERFLAARQRYLEVTPERLREVAAQYLTTDGAVTFLVLPRPAAPEVAAD
ncbi:insulinase family protein [Erythrobacter sp. SDW2]|uniref:M16 family metallopeptidase n=1 Tax=Erythrobacter sp. SDW2 TaxID=2907154 RepID=UPI001F25C2BD|nr:M16 family metallopeptidase [Erythrobacter sp. SDW2]UIP06361.1 insulinase family protein [Erythrobacter sp. SDW2]